MAPNIDLSQRIDNILRELKQVSLHGIRNGDIKHTECLAIIEHRAQDLLLLVNCEKDKLNDTSLGIR